MFYAAIFGERVCAQFGVYFIYHTVYMMVFKRIDQ